MADVLTTLKLNARTKHFAQAVARSRGVTLAELVDELLRDFLADATLPGAGGDKPVSELMKEIWSEHEADRIALIGNRFPEALTERERVLWQGVICKTPRYWKVPLTGKPIRVNEKTFDFERFRAELSLFDDVTRNEMIVQANVLERQKQNAASWPKQKHPLPLSIAKGGNKK